MRKDLQQIVRVGNKAAKDMAKVTNKANMLRKLAKRAEKLHPMGTPVHTVIGPSKRAEEPVDIARLMVTQIANKYIECDTKWEGMDKQRDYYKKAKELVDHFEDYCKLMKMLDVPIK